MKPRYRKGLVVSYKENQDSVHVTAELLGEFPIAIERMVGIQLAASNTFKGS